MMMKTEKNKLQIEGTRVFEDNYNALFNTTKRYIVNEGGSRSSKTYSICQLLLIYLLQNPNKTVSVIRKTRTSVKSSVYDTDFIPMLKELKLYKKANHNKSELTYNFDNGSKIEFIGADDEQKLRGRKRDIAWLNEANELYWDDFKQIVMRTTEKIIIDFNPSVVEHFLYELPEDRTITIHSTWKDNPYLTKEQIEDILDLKRTDPNGYDVFALGKRTTSEENVYKNWLYLSKKPEYMTDFIYGLDFGYNHPTALVKVWFNTDLMEIYIEELIYQSGMTPQELATEMIKVVDQKVYISADGARPELIEELSRYGFNIGKADKSVNEGISNVRGFKVFYNEFALNIKKEYNMYKYKKVNGKITDEVIKKYDDAMDAIRYAVQYIKTYFVRIHTDQPQVYRFDF